MQEVLRVVRHCEEHSDEAIQFLLCGFWIASLGAKLARANFVAISQ